MLRQGTGIHVTALMQLWGFDIAKIIQHSCYTTKPTKQQPRDNSPPEQQLCHNSATTLEHQNHDVQLYCRNKSKRVQNPCVQAQCNNGRTHLNGTLDSIHTIQWLPICAANDFHTTGYLDASIGNRRKHLTDLAASQSTCS